MGGSPHLSRASARIVGLAGLAVASLLATARPAGAQTQFNPSPGDRGHILEGNWQSCQEAGGVYSERVYDHVVNGVPQFEVHFGPRREFAIFKGVQDEHRDHQSAENLLKPYRVPVRANRAAYRWEVPSLNLVFTVNLGGGSRTDC